MTSNFIRLCDQAAKDRQELINSVGPFPGKRSRIVILDPERQRQRQLLHRNVRRWLSWSVKYFRHTGKSPELPAWLREYNAEFILYHLR